MPQHKLTEECESIKQRWKQRFEASDKETKAFMITQFNECKNLAKMETEPSLCMCVSIDPKLWNKNCKKIKKNWDKTYLKADEETKKDMKQEILDCNTEEIVEEKPKNKLEDVSDENFCDCMNYFGGKLSYELSDNPDEKKIEQYDKINKAAKNRCTFAMRDINIGTMEVIDRSRDCKQLEKYFLDSTHIFSVQKIAVEGIYKILDKYNDEISPCSCIEIMKLEKSLLDENSQTIQKRTNIQVVFEKTRSYCAALINGMTDDELKQMEEEIKNCK